MNVDQNIFQIHNHIGEVSILKKSFFFVSYLVYLGTSCNRTDDDNASIVGPDFNEYPSGAGKK
jgi:hypothetical protein